MQTTEMQIAITYSIPKVNFSNFSNFIYFQNLKKFNFKNYKIKINKIIKN